MGENSSVGTRRRAESLVSTAGEGMDVVKDEKERHDNDEEQASEELVRNPLKLRGRGGFSHPRPYSSKIELPKSSTGPSAGSTDPVDSLASSMSALQFVPPSVRMARGRGRGRGG